MNRYNEFTSEQLCSYAAATLYELDRQMTEINLNFSFIPMQNRNFQAHYIIETKLEYQMDIWRTFIKEYGNKA